MAFATFSALGSMVASSVELRGIAGRFSEPITRTGASKCSKQFWEMLPASAWAKEFTTGSSVTIRHLECFLSTLSVDFSAEKTKFWDSVEIKPFREVCKMN